jgi:GTPase Era involved in 16S rRNA processing
MKRTGRSCVHVVHVVQSKPQMLVVLGERGQRMAAIRDRIELELSLSFRIRVYFHLTVSVDARMYERGPTLPAGGALYV